MQTEDLLTIEEAAALIGISPVSVRYAINANLLEHVRLYNKRLVPRAAALAYRPIGHRPKTATPRIRRGKPGRPKKTEKGGTADG